MNQNRPAMSSVVATDSIKSIFTILRRGCILPHYLLLLLLLLIEQQWRIIQHYEYKILKYQKMVF